MSDNQDLKSKILSMRQKNFGEVINQSNEKNDNEKPENIELKHSKDNDKPNSDENKISKKEVNEINQNNKNLEVSNLKDNINKVANTNEKAFNLLANKFNESVEVILELTQRVEKLETVSRLQAMQESTKKNNIEKPGFKGLKLFIFLMFISAVSYFIYKYKIDLSILKEISEDFLAVIRK